MNNDNERYSFSVTPADAETAQAEQSAQTNAAQQIRSEMTGEISRMKKSMTRLIAICCVVCLIAGVGGGALIGTIINRGGAADQVQYQEPAATTASSSATTAESREEDIFSNGRLYAVSNGGGESMSVEKVVETVEASVVSIRVETQTANGYYYEESYTATGSGSGVIITDNGYVVTNNHVIEGANKIVVILNDETEYEATLVGSDDVTDIAILKIEASNLPFAVIGNSDNLKRGQPAIVIGNPLGTLSGTVTVGVISGLDRNITMSDGGTMNLLQIDAAVNPGNSGGGLFNDKGELVGIIVAKTSATDVEGLGFAIPVTDILSILDELMEKGYVSGRPALGITLKEITSAMDLMMYRVNYLGVYVASVANPETNPLQSYDLILTVEGESITTTTQIADILADKQAGDVLSIEVLRGSERLKLDVTLVEEGTLNR